MESAYGATVDINSTLRYSENRCNYAELVNFGLSIKYFRGKQVQIFVNVNDFVPRIINQSRPTENCPTTFKIWLALTSFVIIVWNKPISKWNVLYKQTILWH